MLIFRNPASVFQKWHQNVEWLFNDVLGWQLKTQSDFAKQAETIFGIIVIIIILNVLQGGFSLTHVPSKEWVSGNLTLCQFASLLHP